jgi:hypothetical protein
MVIENSSLPHSRCHRKQPNGHGHGMQHSLGPDPRSTPPVCSGGLSPHCSSIVVGVPQRNEGPSQLDNEGKKKEAEKTKVVQV